MPGAVLRGQMFTPAGEYITDFYKPQNLTLNAISPGGWASATWTSQVGAPYLGIAEARQNSKIEIYDLGGGLVFRGRMEDPGYLLEAPRGSVNLIAHGYGMSMSDRCYAFAKTFPAGSTPDAIMRGVRDDLCPDIDSGNRLITRVTTRTLAATTGSYLDQRPAEIFRQVAAVGDQNDNPLLWHVWEGLPGSTRKAELEVIARPTTPSYYVAIADGARLDLSSPLSEMYNRVMVRWGSPTTRTPVDDALSQAAPPIGYGVRRDFIFDAPQIRHVNDATNIGRSLLTRLSTVRARGRSLTIPSGCRIEDAAGGVIAPYLVRCGRMIEVADLRSAAISPSQYRFVVAAASYNDATGALSLTPEQIDPLVAGLSRLAALGL